MRIGSALKDIADFCESAGISAAVDARELTLPGAWVTPGTVTFETMSNSKATMDFVVYLVARDNGPTQSLDDLGEMLEKLREVIPVPEALPVMMSLPNQGAGEMPALQITITATVD